MCEIERIEGYDREAFDTWYFEKEAIAVLGDTYWPGRGRVEVGMVGKNVYFETHDTVGNSDWPLEIALIRRITTHEA